MATEDCGKVEGKNELYACRKASSYIWLKMAFYLRRMNGIEASSSTLWERKKNRILIGSVSFSPQRDII